jgi:gamma-glutamylcyclotransferase
LSEFALLSHTHKVSGFLLSSSLGASASNIMASSATKNTVYFGYGSNLWRQQMAERCPESIFVGIGRLSGYRWQINDRGYANVVELQPDETTSKAHTNDFKDVVYGLIYTLTALDEARLDVNEGVPFAYTKETLTVDFWPAQSTESSAIIDTVAEPEKKDMLVYINRKETKDSKPKKEYIVRMNHGIDDALAAGVPEGYVNEVIRKSIPPIDEKDIDQDLKEQVKRQARNFTEE